MSIENQIQTILTKKIEQYERESLDEKVINLIGVDTREQIIKRTRLGFGVSPPGGGLKNNLLPLRPKTIKKRRYYRHNLSPFTQPSRSGLTATGQLLDSITYEFMKTASGVIIRWFFKENRSFELEGGAARIRHKQLAKLVEKNGRPFFYLTNFEVNKIKSILFNYLNNH